MLAFSQNLERKSSGPDVVQLQQRLRELGYFTYPENTGYFGDDTARALAQFQAQHGLAPTGIADRGTIEAINRCGEDCIGPASGAEDQ
jgi:peptidoglycan hydrolase-like protein with peptidoglycan-binding domain